MEDLRQLRIQFLVVLQLEVGEAVRRGKFLEGGENDAGACLGTDEVSAEERTLGRLDREVSGVIVDEELDRQLVVDERLQLLQVHLNGAVALEADERTRTVRKGGADCRGESVTHGGAGFV